MRQRAASPPGRPAGSLQRGQPRRTGLRWRDRPRRPCPAPGPTLGRADERAARSRLRGSVCVSGNRCYQSWKAPMSRPNLPQPPPSLRSRRPPLPQSAAAEPKMPISEIVTNCDNFGGHGCSPLRIKVVTNRDNIFPAPAKLSQSVSSWIDTEAGQGCVNPMTVRGIHVRILHLLSRRGGFIPRSCICCPELVTICDRQVSPPRLARSQQRDPSRPTRAGPEICQGIASCSLMIPQALSPTSVFTVIPNRPSPLTTATHHLRNAGSCDRHRPDTL
jgi:hypothetical protein